MRREDENYGKEHNVPEEFQVYREDEPDGNGCRHRCRKPILFAFNVLYVVSIIRGIKVVDHVNGGSTVNVCLLDLSKAYDIK